MTSAEYRGIYFEEPHLQAEFERLLQAVTEAERQREPLAERHRKAERQLDDQDISFGQFREVDDQYIAANNKIAAAKRTVNNFLNVNRNYKTR